MRPLARSRTAARARRLIAAAVAWVCVSGTGGVASAQLIDAPWPMFQHDLQHTGRTTAFAGPSGTTAAERWKVKTTGWPKTAPAVGPDGKIYYAAGFKALCVVGADGIAPDCDPKSGDANTSSPALGQPITGSHPYHIYRGARDNKLWSLNPDLTFNWSHKIQLDGDITVSVAIAPATANFPGTIFMACGCLSRGILFAINPFTTDPAQRVRWQLDLGESNYNSAPAISPSGRIYIGGQGGTLFAIDDLPTGPQFAWTMAGKHGIKAPGANKNRNSSPTLRVLPSGKTAIYMGSNAGLSAFQDEGASATHLWTEATAGAVDTTPAIGTDMLVASSWKTGVRTVYAFDFDGDLLWKRSGPATSVSKYAQSPSAVIDKDGTIYQGIGKKVYAITPANADRWTQPFTLPADAIGMALDEGVLYVGAKNSYLYALENP